jgi:hypothetical protein
MGQGIVNGDKHFISGGGGRSHYSCSENTQWTFCNDSDYGYLKLEIKPDGTTKTQFLDYNGGVKN